MGRVQHVWSSTKTRPPVFIGPVRALLGEAHIGRGRASEISMTVVGCWVSSDANSCFKSAPEKGWVTGGAGVGDATPSGARLEEGPAAGT